MQQQQLAVESSGAVKCVLQILNATIQCELPQFYSAASSSIPCSSSILTVQVGTQLFRAESSSSIDTNYEQHQDNNRTPYDPYNPIFNQAFEFSWRPSFGQPLLQLFHQQQLSTNRSSNNNNNSELLLIGSCLCDMSMENTSSAAGQIKRGVLSVEQLMVGCVFYTIQFAPYQQTQGVEQQQHWNQQTTLAAATQMLQQRKGPLQSQQPIVIGNQMLKGNILNSNNNSNNYQSAGYKILPGAEQTKSKTVASHNADSPLRRVQTDTNAYPSSSSQLSNARSEMLPSSNKQILSQQQIQWQSQLPSQIGNNNNNSESLRLLQQQQQQQRQQQQQHYNDTKNTSYSSSTASTQQTHSSQFLKYQVKSSKNSTDLKLAQNQNTQNKQQQQQQPQHHQQFISTITTTAVAVASTTAKKRPTGETSSMYEGRFRSQTEQAEEDTNNSEYYADIENVQHAQGIKQTEEDMQALVQFRRRAERSASPFQTTTAALLQQQQQQSQHPHQYNQAASSSSFGLTSSSSREASPGTNKTFKIYYKNNRGHSQQSQIPSAASQQQGKKQQQQQIQQQTVLALSQLKQQQQLLKQSYSQQNQLESSQDDASRQNNMNNNALSYDYQQRLEGIQLANQQTQERITAEEARLTSILEQNSMLREQIDFERTSLISEISSTQERLTRSREETEVLSEGISAVTAHEGEAHSQIAQVLQNMKDTNRRVILGRQGRNIKARQLDSDCQVLDGLLRRAAYFKEKVRKCSQKNLVFNEIRRNRMNNAGQNKRSSQLQEEQNQNRKQHARPRAVSEKSLVVGGFKDQSYNCDENDSKYLSGKIDLQEQEGDKQSIGNGEDAQRTQYFDTFEEYQRLLQELSHLSVMEQTVREKLSNLEEKIKEISLEKEKQEERDEDILQTQDDDEGEQADNDQIDQAQQSLLGKIANFNRNISMAARGHDFREQSIVEENQVEEGQRQSKEPAYQQQQQQQKKQQWKHSQQQDYYYSNAGRDQSTNQQQQQQGLSKDRHYLLTFNQDQNNRHQWEVEQKQQQKQQEIDSDDDNEEEDIIEGRQEIDQGQEGQIVQQQQQHERIDDNQPSNGFGDDDDGTVIQLIPRSFNAYYSNSQSFEQEKEQQPEVVLQLGGGGYISSDSQYLSRFSNNTSTHEERIREVSPLQIDTANNEYFISSNSRSKSSSSSNSSSRKITTKRASNNHNNSNNNMNSSVRIYHGGMTPSSSCQSGNSISSSNSQQSSSFGSGNFDNQELENVVQSQQQKQRCEFQMQQQHAQMLQNITVNDRIAPLFGGGGGGVASTSDRCSVTAGNSPKAAGAATAGGGTQSTLFGKAQQKGSQKSADLLVGNYQNNRRNQTNNDDVNQFNRAGQQQQQQPNLLHSQLLQQSQQLYYNPNNSANIGNALKQQQQQQQQQQAQQYQLEQQQAVRNIHKSFDNFISQQQQQQQQMQQQNLQEHDQLTLPLALQRGLSHHEFSGAAKKPYPSSTFSIARNSPINNANSFNSNTNSNSSNSGLKFSQLSAAEETLHAQLLNTAPTLFNQYFSSRRLQQQQQPNNSNGISRK